MKEIDKESLSKSVFMIEEIKTLKIQKEEKGINTTEQENTYLWQTYEDFANEINRLRELNGKLRLLLVNNGIETDE